jgi:hypothetical protein
MSDFIVQSVEEVNKSWEKVGERYCVDCIHCQFSASVGQHRCHHPIHGLNLVTKVNITPSCTFERSLAGKCSKIGVNYEPIPTQGTV